MILSMKYLVEVKGEPRIALLEYALPSAGAAN
jgi:hypothetical protein